MKFCYVHEHNELGPEGSMAYYLTAEDDEAVDALNKLELEIYGSFLTILDNTNGVYSAEVDYPPINFIAHPCENTIIGETFEEARNWLANYVRDRFEYEREAEAIRVAEIKN